MAKQAKQTMVSFGDAICCYFQKFADFSGTAQRSEYWWVMLFFFLINLVLMWIPFLNMLVGFILLIPTLALTVRRLHDMGQSGHWLWGYLLIIPLMFGSVLSVAVGSSGGLVVTGMFGILMMVWSIAVFVMTLMPSKFKDNKFRK